MSNLVQERINNYRLVLRLSNAGTDIAAGAAIGFLMNAAFVAAGSISVPLFLGMTVAMALPIFGVMSLIICCSPFAMRDYNEPKLDQLSIAQAARKGFAVGVTKSFTAQLLRIPLILPLMAARGLARTYKAFTDNRVPEDVAAGKVPEETKLVRIRLQAVEKKRLDVAVETPPPASRKVRASHFPGPPHP